MSTGISAPPTRMANKIPNTVEARIMATQMQMARGNAREAANPIDIRKVTIKKREPRMRVWCLSSTGGWFNRLASLPAAMIEPERVNAPMANPSSPDILLTMERLPAPLVSWTKAIKKEANPPAPFWNATIDGI
ncbi:MAG: hypothetical protein HUN05_06235 [Desulfobacter sp.]|nr:MAG: hypothetical protein HUN05_06235 [Desulfobacter sp.]